MASRHEIQSEYVVAPGGSYTVSLGTFAFNEQATRFEREHPAYDIRVIPIFRGYAEHIYMYGGEPDNLEDCQGKFPQVVALLRDDKLPWWP